MKKIAIVYGELNNDIQKRAVEELTEIILDYTSEYPVCLPYDDGVDTDSFSCIYIGTKESNPYIARMTENSLTIPESYSIRAGADSIIIEGYDDAGVLYGTLDFYNRFVIKFEYPPRSGNANENWVELLDKNSLPRIEFTSAPSVKERGLWTWGHVIYDYRKYLHNMMKLKMNSVIIWNDFVPTNARDIVAYAHSCNIKVYWGFAWLWDTSFNKISIKDLEGEPEKILRKYESQYASSEGDGIYFQTFTELNEDNIDGVLIAEAAAKFVNKTSSLLYSKYPDIEIQFGLHASSVKNKLEFIGSVDPRIRIVWEDCGAFPFAYDPTKVDNFDETKDFVEKIANLRGSDDRFGAVTKGFTTLDWTKFEHLKGSQCIGVSSEGLRKVRAVEKARKWRYIRAGWMINSDKALEAVKQMCELKKGDLSVFALVEDGLFEENIMYPVALYSEMLWNCRGDVKELMTSVSFRDYVRYE